MQKSFITQKNGNAAPALGRVLQFKPNPLMDTKKCLYRLATAYMTDNNAVIAPIIEYDEIKGFYPLAVGNAQLIDYGGEIYVRCRIAAQSLLTSSAGVV